MNKICHVNSLCHLFSWGKEGRIYNIIEEANIFYSSFDPVMNLLFLYHWITKISKITE